MDRRQHVARLSAGSQARAGTKQRRAAAPVPWSWAAGQQYEVSGRVVAAELTNLGQLGQSIDIEDRHLRAVGTKDHVETIGCHVARQARGRFRPAIVGGTNAARSRWGFMAYVGYLDPTASPFACSGTVVSINLILTAGQVIVDPAHDRRPAPARTPLCSCWQSRSSRRRSAWPPAPTPRSSHRGRKHRSRAGEKRRQARAVDRRSGKRHRRGSSLPRTAASFTLTNCTIRAFTPAARAARCRRTHSAGCQS